MSPYLSVDDQDSDASYALVLSCRPSPGVQLVKVSTVARRADGFDPSTLFERALIAVLSPVTSVIQTGDFESNSRFSDWTQTKTGDAATFFSSGAGYNPSSPSTDSIGWVGGYYAGTAALTQSIPTLTAGAAYQLSVNLGSAYSTADRCVTVVSIGGTELLRGKVCLDANLQCTLVNRVGYKFRSDTLSYTPTTTGPAEIKFSYECATQVNNYAVVDNVSLVRSA
jgi:hypothetical protein